MFGLKKAPTEIVPLLQCLQTPVGMSVSSCQRFTDRVKDSFPSKKLTGGTERGRKRRKRSTDIYVGATERWARSQ